MTKDAASSEPACKPIPPYAELGRLVGYLLLVLVPIALKLLHLTRVGSWSWWWVTAPLWGFAALLGAIGFVAVLLHWVQTALDL